MRYRIGTMTWPELVAFMKTFPFAMPVYPDDDDWNAWHDAPDTGQPGTFGEVVAAWDLGYLTDEEFYSLLEDYLPPEDGFGRP